MTEIVQFLDTKGQPLLVEVEDDAFGLERIARNDAGVVEAGRRLEETIAVIRPAIRSVVETLKDLAPDEHEVEFGVKLTAEAGALVAKTAVEGHFIVRMHWRRDPPAG